MSENDYFVLAVSLGIIGLVMIWLSGWQTRDEQRKE